MDADERLSDWYTWFRENLNRGRDHDKEIKFLHRALEGLMECVIILRAEQRRERGVRSMVVIPGRE